MAEAATASTNDQLVPTRGAPASDEQKDIFSYSKRVVVIKGMPEDVTEEDVQSFLGDAGVESIKIRPMRRRRQPLVGVKFAEQEAASAAIEKFNGTSFKDAEITCEPKRMLKRSARRKRPKMIVSFDPQTVVVRVENATEDAVRDLVTKYGEVDTFEAKASGITFIVKFKTEEQAAAAIADEGVTIGDNEVRTRKYRVRTPAPVEEKPAKEPKAAKADGEGAKKKKKRKPKAKKADTGSDKAGAAETQEQKAPRESTPRKPRANKRLFVAGFPVDTDPNDILDLMEGSIRATVRNQTAFVNFSEVEEAQAAIDKFSEQYALKSDQPLRVEFKRQGYRNKGRRNRNRQRAAPASAE